MGRGAALGPKFCAHADEPGAGDSIGLREHLEKCPESSSRVVTACQGCVGQAGKGADCGTLHGNQALGPRAASPGLLAGYVMGALMPSALCVACQLCARRCFRLWGHCRDRHSVPASGS